MLFIQISFLIWHALDFITLNFKLLLLLLIYYLRQSWKNVAQLKETLKKERDASQKLKRKYKDMIGEVKTSRTECQTMQEDKNSLAISVENTEKSAQVTLVELQKLQLEHQMLETEKDNLQLSYGNISEEKNKLESMVTELEMEKATAGEKIK